MSNPWDYLINAAIKNNAQELADNVTRNNSLLKRFNKANHWRQIWLAAAANMPWQDQEDQEFQQIEVLARCLGIPESDVTQCWSAGREPKSPEFEAKLRGYAGAYGTQLAAIRLANLGAIDQYPHWPPS